MRLGIVALLALASGGCTAPEDEPGCTLIGCSDGLTFELGSPHQRWVDELPLTLQGCVAENCRSWVLDAKDCKPAGYGYGYPYSCTIDYRQQVEMAFPLPERGERELPVALTVHSKDGEVLFEGQLMAKIAPHHPNGYDCDKYYPCYSGTVDFSSQYP